jgi:4-amino-4-deoxy-L-arabinose transferase-like glycosyltransferase
MRLLLLWIISPILFFSLSRFKLDYYFLPSMPPAVLLLAHSLSDSDTMTAGSQRIRNAIWVILLLIVVATIVLTLPVIETNFGGLRLRWLPYGVAVLSLVVSALLTRGKSAQRTVLAAAFSVWLTTISTILVFLPTYAQGRPVTALATSVPPAATVYFVGDAAEWAWDLALYQSVSKPIQFLSKAEAIQQLKFLSMEDHSAAIFMYKQEYEQALKAGLQMDRVAKFEVRRGDNLTWKSLRHPIRDVLYVVTHRVPLEATP